MSEVRIDVHDKPVLKEWIPLSIQHVFAMFGATVLVPMLTGLSPAVALFTSGVGTLLYILITKGKVPAYLGSSFAFIAPIIAISSSADFGVAYALGGAFCVGLFYCLISLIISRFGIGWMDRLLPPVVIGSIIIVIGLKLAPVAMDMAMTGGSGVYSLAFFSIAIVTLSIAVISSIVLKGFFNVIPILIGIVGGYIFTLIMGAFFPAFKLIDFAIVGDAAWFGIAKPVMPRFHWVPILTFLIVSLATIAEHLGDTLVLSKVVGKDFYKDPGLHRTLAGDGIATSVAALFGGPPNTTYGENIGVMAITRVYSVLGHRGSRRHGCHPVIHSEIRCPDTDDSRTGHGGCEHDAFRNHCQCRYPDCCGERCELWRKTPPDHLICYPGHRYRRGNDPVSYRKRYELRTEWSRSCRGSRNHTEPCPSQKPG